jgi:hypothetical protein
VLFGDLKMRLPIIVAALALALPASAAGPAPHVRAQSFDQFAQPLPLPYNESVDAIAAVNKARARARASHKLLLIDLGGNWASIAAYLLAPSSCLRSAPLSDVIMSSSPSMWAGSTRI